MNEQTDFERLVADQIASAGVGMPPESAITETIARAGGSRRLPGWLALVKEPPMRSNKQLAVGSPTVRVIAVMAATLLLASALAAAGIAGARLLAATGPIVVAQDGSGSVKTITDAVAAAEDGDEIHVKPGVYAESVLIDGLDIVLRGDGPRDEIIIEAPGEQPAAEFSRLPFGLALIDSEATVSGLTLRGRDSRVHIGGGAPTLEDLVLDGTGEVYTGSNSSALDSISFYEGSGAVFADSEVIAGGSVGIHDRAQPQILGNTFSDGTNIYVQSPGSELLIEGNSIIDSASRAIGIWSDGPFTIKGNTIENPGDAEAILDSGGSSALIADNVISGDRGGIVIGNGSQATVASNQINVGLTGISVASSDVTVSDNIIKGGSIGIRVSGRGSSPTVIDNAIDGPARGMVVSRGSSPSISGNVVCASEVSLDIQEGAEPDLGENEICEAGATEQL